MTPPSMWNEEERGPSVHDGNSCSEFPNPCTVFRTAVYDVGVAGELEFKKALSATGDCKMNFEDHHPISIKISSACYKSIILSLGRARVPAVCYCIAEQRMALLYVVTSVFSRYAPSMLSQHVLDM